MKRFLLRVMWGIITVPLTILSCLFLQALWRLETVPEWSRDYDPIDLVFSLVAAIVFFVTFAAWTKVLGSSPSAVLGRLDDWLHRDQG